jgi:hypothetical protein
VETESTSEELFMKQWAQNDINYFKWFLRNVLHEPNLGTHLRYEFKWDSRHIDWTGRCSGIPEVQDMIFPCLSSNLRQQFRKHRVPSALHVCIHLPVLKCSIFLDITSTDVSE